MTVLLDEMKAHALEAQRFSRKHLVLELDFSRDSIEALEGQADSVTFAIRGGKSPENIAMLTRIWGAYLGESLRKSTGAEWVEESAGQVRRLGLRGPQGDVHPHERIQQRLHGTKDDSLLIFFDQALKILEK